MNKETPIRPWRVAVVQNSAGADRERNLARIEEMIRPAPAADLIALPEVFAQRGGDADYRRESEPVQ